MGKVPGYRSHFTPLRRGGRFFRVFLLRKQVVVECILALVEVVFGSLLNGEVQAHTVLVVERDSVSDVDISLEFADERENEFPEVFRINLAFIRLNEGLWPLKYGLPHSVLELLD